MLLFIVGPVDPEQMIEFIRQDQAGRAFTNQREIQRKFADEPFHVAKTENVLRMNVQTPKCMVGIKGPFLNQKGDVMLKSELTVQLLLDLLFSRSSENYRQLYGED